MPKLKHKQLKFCEEYVVDLNATQAAIRAGYSPKSARLSGHRNMNNDNILSKIAELQAELRQVAVANGDVVDPEELLHGYTNDIRFDPASLYDEKHKLIPIPKLPKQVRLSLCGAKYNAQGQLEYKYPDKNKVRDSVAKLLGLTNGNAGIIKELLESLGLVQINVQQNVQIKDSTVQIMEKAIERCGSST